MRTAALAAAAANKRLAESCVQLDDVLDDVGISAGAAASRLNDLRNAVGETAMADSRLVSEMNDLRTAVAENTIAINTLAGRVNDLRGSFITAAAAAALLGKTSDAAGGRAAAAGAGMRLFGTGIRVGATAIHAMVSGVVEFLAVAIPAAVAAGAWAAAWAQGAQNVTQHMNAVYTATEATSKMFHVTAGQAVGLGDALQKAQNAANPNVYQALGSAVLIIRERFGGLAQVGVRVGRIFDSFAAKLVYDFSAAGGAGARLTGLLSGAIPDLVMFGQIFGNLGHALLNFASDMPGLAQGMLAFLDALSRVILAISRLPSWVIKGAFALHEFNIWGTVLNSTLGKLGFSVDQVSGSFLGLARAKGIFLSLFNVIPRMIGAASISVGTLVGRLAGIVPGAEKAGTAIVRVGTQAEEAAAGLGFMEAAAITLGAAGIGFLIYKMVTAKTAAQQFAASLQDTANKASNFQVLNVLAKNMGVLHERIAQTDAMLRGFGSSTTAGTEKMHAFGSAATGVSNYLNQARDSVNTLTAAEKSMGQQFVIVGQHTGELASTYHTSLIGAMALATTAGVKLNQTMGKQAWAMAQIKIASLVQGYRSMGQPMGVVGSDMTALAIQSGLAATKVSALNQAWDEFMQNLTGGTAGLAGFVTSMKNIGQVAGTTANNLATSTGSMTLSTKQFADALTHYTGKGAGAWTNFDQVVGSTIPQVTDWLRTAGAEGAISGTKFTQAILGMVRPLIPLAAKSKAAQAEVLGLVQQADPAVKTWGQLGKAIKNAGASTAQTGKDVNGATIKMGNMAQVAQQLGNVLSTDLNNMMAEARLKVSGVSQALVTYDQKIRDGTSGTLSGHRALQTLIKDIMWATGDTYKQAAALAKLQAQWNNWHPATKTLTTNLVTSGSLPGSGGRHYTGGGPGTGNSVMVVHQHIAGSVLSDQQLARAAQGAGLRQTLRNGSTQAFIPGRLH